MPVFQRICCPIDFSPASREALEIAVEMARRFGAGLTVLHATSAHWPGPEILVEPPADTGGLGDAGALGAWMAEAERSLGAPVSSVLLSAPIAEAIVSFARDFGTDLIVMSSHGRGGLGRLLQGSVAEAVARTAPCPVMIVRRKDDPGTPGAGETEGMPA